MYTFVQSAKTLLLPISLSIFALDAYTPAQVSELINCFQLCLCDVNAWGDIRSGLLVQGGGICFIQADLISSPNVCTASTKSDIICNMACCL